jgi:hypothetical protein
LCLAAAIGIGFASRWNGKKYRGLIFTALLVAAWADVAFFSWLPVPAIRQKIAPRGPIAAMTQSQEEFAVFDLPIQAGKESLNRYVTNQLFHDRPILYSNFSTVSHPFPRSLARENLAVNLFALAGPPENGDSQSKEPFHHFADLGLIAQAGQALDCLYHPAPHCEARLEELDQHLHQLADLKITRFLLHEDLLPEKSRLPEVAQRLLGPPVAEKENIKLYRLVKD